MTTVDADRQDEPETVGGQEVRTNWGPVVAIGLAMLVVTSELTMAAVTLPGVGRHFGIGPAATAWVLLAYSLPMAAIAIPAGRWTDGADVRSAFLLALGGVGVASVLSALTPTFWLLLTSRALQGIAAGLIVATYMPIVATSVAHAQRGRAMGYIVTIMTLGAMVGVPIGGFVAGALSWREVFLLKLPLLAVVAWLGWRRLARGGRGLPRPGRSLLVEAGLLGAAIAGVLLGVDQLAARPVPGALLVLTGLALSYGWYRLRSSRPVLALVRTPAFGGVLFALFSMSMTIGLIAFLLPYLVADVLHGSAEMTGVVLLFFVGAVAPVGPLAGWLADRYGAGVIALAGAVLCVVGMLLMLGLGPGAGVPELAWRLVLFGIGAGLFNAPVNTALLASTPPDMAGTSGGLMMTARTIAATIGPVLAALCWTLAGGGLAGFRTGVLVLAAFASLAMLIMTLPAARRTAEPAVTQTG